jgi:mono/diheme cytochrome c family protein
VKSIIALALCLLAWPSAASAQARLERGRYLVEGIAACGNCHTPKGPDGKPVAGKHLAGGFEITEGFGVAVASNITPDRTTGIGAWSDAEIVKAIREGKSRDGRTLGPPMPYGFYRRLSDVDVKAIVTYLRTVPAVENHVAKSRYTMPLPPSWGPPVGRVPPVSRRDRVKYGEYLAGPVAHCMECHAPQGSDGAPDLTKLGAGGFPFRGPWGVSYSANLTPDRETGIGTWTDSEIVASIHGARRGGGRVRPPMPVDQYVRGISAPDLKAIVAYLRSLPPITNAVPAPEAPKK